MKDFAELLDKKADKVVVGKSILKTRVHRKIKVSYIGDWALSEWIKSEWHSSKRERNYCKKYHTDPKCKNFVEHNINCFGGGIHWNIAIACLGEKEVKKRLKKMERFSSSKEENGD